MCFLVVCGVWNEWFWGSNAGMEIVTFLKREHTKKSDETKKINAPFFAQPGTLVQYRVKATKKVDKTLVVSTAFLPLPGAAFKSGLIVVS